MVKSSSECNRLLTISVCFQLLWIHVLPVCVCVCMTTNRTPPVTPVTTLIPQKVLYKLLPVLKIFLYEARVSYVLAGVMTAQECAFHCVSSPAVPSCGGPAAPALPLSTDTLTRPAWAQVSLLTSPLSNLKIDSFVCCFLQVIVRSAS